MDHHEAVGLDLGVGEREGHQVLGRQFALDADHRLEGDAGLEAGQARHDPEGVGFDPRPDLPPGLGSLGRQGRLQGGAQAEAPGRQGDGVCQAVVQGEAAAARQGVAGAHQGGDGEGPLGDDLEAVEAGRVEGEAEVRLAPAHQLGHRIGAGDPGGHLDPRQGRPEGGEDLGRQGDRDAFHRGQAHLAPLQAAQGVELRDDPLVVADGPPEVAAQHPPGLGEAQASADPIEEGDAQRRLELQDLPVDGRGRHVELVRGAADRARLGHRQKVAVGRRQHRLVAVHGRPPPRARATLLPQSRKDAQKPARG